MNAEHIMDADYFLKQRTAFIKFFYDVGAPAFEKLQAAIEAGESPFDNPPFSDDPEPPFLKEWMEARTGIEVLGQSCVSLLSDSLKLYFETLRTRVIGFEWSKDLQTLASKQGFVAAYKAALGDILQTDWSDCPARFEVIEQIVLTRNRGQHGTDLTTLNVRLDGHTLRKHPNPFFTEEHERQLWIETGGNPDALFGAPSLTITRANLFEAVAETDKLAEWIESRMGTALSWRYAQSRPKT